MITIVLTDKNNKNIEEYQIRKDLLPVAEKGILEKTYIKQTYRKKDKDVYYYVLHEDIDLKFFIIGFLSSLKLLSQEKRECDNCDNYYDDKDFDFFFCDAGVTLEKQINSNKECKYWRKK